MKMFLSGFLILSFLLISGCTNHTHGIYEINIEANLIENNFVGDEWNIKYKHNNEKIENRYKILKELDKNNIINIEIKIAEIDDFPDIANEKISLSLQNEETKTKKIIVTENKGRYKNNIAVWEIKISAKCVKKLTLT